MQEKSKLETGIIIGVDVGGTFTDVVTLNRKTGEISVAKHPTTTDDPSIGVINALNALDWPLSAVSLIIHGTTITTNALLQRRMARTGMITTRGFRDVIELGRRTRPNAYGLMGKFTPVIPRDLRLEVTERIDAKGTIRIPLDLDEVRQAARSLLAKGCESVVVHFLHASTNPDQELLAERVLRELWPNDNITLGHRLVPEVREYERGVTAAINASVRPILERYVRRLSQGLAQSGYNREFLLMNGNGGTVSASRAPEEAALTVMSGPASGVIAAARAAVDASLGRLMTYDMGGTSTDVALIADGRPLVSSEIEIDYALPIHVPMVDVRTIGAGGGSILWIDPAGLLRVGPDSAGSVPGPIAFGRGGTRPTITDANVLLGRLELSDLLGVDKPASGDEIAAAFERDLCGPLGLDAYAAAEAALKVANLRMAGAIRLISIDRGHDPRDFVLFAFGGGGPLHASAVAGELRVPRIVVPPRPGITNAIGCLIADLRHEAVKTVNAPLETCDAGAIDRLLADQLNAGRAALEREAVVSQRIEVERSVDMKFTGQTHLIRVPLPQGPVDLKRLNDDFAEAYFVRFRVRLPEVRATLFTVRTSVIGVRQRVDLDGLLPLEGRAASVADATTGRRPVRFDGQTHDTPVIDRARLPKGSQIAGPAILTQLDTTTVLEPGDIAVTDDTDTLVISKPGDRSDI